MGIHVIGNLLPHEITPEQNYLKHWAEKERADKRFSRMAVIVQRCTRLLPKYIWDMFEQILLSDEGGQT